MVDQVLDPPTATPMIAPLRWLGLAVAVIIAAIGAGLGFWQHLPALNVMFYTAAIFALLIWIWSNYLVRWIVDSAVRNPASRGPISARAALRGFIARRAGVLGGSSDSDPRLRYSLADRHRLFFLAEFSHGAGTCGSDHPYCGREPGVR